MRCDQILGNAFKPYRREAKLNKLHTSKNEARISIADNGIGISANDKRKLFTPLFHTKARGSGLVGIYPKNSSSEWRKKSKSPANRKGKYFHHNSSNKACMMNKPRLLIVDDDPEWNDFAIFSRQGLPGDVAQSVLKIWN